MSELRVCIDARVVGEASGGIEQLLIGLASSLSKLQGEERYLFLGIENQDGWLRPHLGPNSEVTRLPGPQPDPEWKRWMRSTFPSASQRWYEVRRRMAELSWSLSPRLDPPSGTSDLLGAEKVDVIHLPNQAAIRTDLPVVYEPHDLQHVHLPENFTPRTRAERERNIAFMTERGAFVAVASTWVKDDLVRHFGTDPRKVYVIPLAPPLAVYRDPTAGELRAMALRHQLPKDFIFYPAQTWPHKNHRVLLEAAAILKRRRTRIELVFSGQLNCWSSSLRLLARRLGVEAQVRFLGFVPPTDLVGLFRLARCVAIPTLFEAASFPMWEAFLAGTPVACSTVTSLPAQAAGAARHFDPHDASGVADVLEDIMTNESARSALIAAGTTRVRQFSWDQTARMFRSLYRLAAGRSLSAEESSLLDSPPII